MTAVIIAVVFLGLAACGGGLPSQSTAPTPPDIGGGGGTPTPGAGSGTGAPAGSGTTADLPGLWLGPAPGDKGSCGSEVSEWTLGRDGRFSTTVRSDDCADFTLSGTYTANSSTIAFHQTRQTCNVSPCTQDASYSVTYAFVGRDSLQVTYGPGETVSWHRQ
jgi:hypothetical protein